MKKLEISLLLFGIGFLLSPILAFSVLMIFAIYRLILSRFVRKDNLMITISLLLGLLMLILAYRFTGIPRFVKMLIAFLSGLIHLKIGTEEFSLLLSYWSLYLFDFWGWAFSLFGFASLINASISHTERMIKRETDRRASRFTDDYIPDYFDEKHQLVLGTTGSGKTAYINDMARSTACIPDKDKNKEKLQGDLLVYLDGKADVGEHSLFDNARQIAKESGKELVILNGTDNPEFDGCVYNPFYGCSITQAKDLIISLIDDDSLKKSTGSEHYRVMFEAYLLSTLEIMEILGIKFSFNNILTCLNFDRIGTVLLSKRDALELENEQIYRFDTLYSELASNWEDSKASVTKLDIFRKGRGHYIFDGDSDKWFNVSSIYENNQILVALIDEMSMPEFAQGLAKMVVQDVRNFAASRMNGKYSRGQQVRLVLDEFSAYANKTMLTLLSRARTAGITVYLSTQSMGDLQALGDDFKQAVIDNINRFVIFRQNSPESAELVANIIGTRQTVTQTERTSGGLATDEANNTLAREYYINPDEIKELPAHTAFYVAKDEGKVYKFVNKWKKEKPNFINKIIQKLR